MKHGVVESVGTSLNRTFKGVESMTKVSGKDPFTGTLFDPSASAKSLFTDKQLRSINNANSIAKKACERLTGTPSSMISGKPILF